MSKYFVAQTLSSNGDGYTDDLELCVLTVTPELIEDLKTMQRQTLALEEENPDLDEAAFRLRADWYESAMALDEIDESALDDGRCVIETETDPFEGEEAARTDMDRVLVWPTGHYPGDDLHEPGERYCEFTLRCIRKHSNCWVHCHAFTIKQLEAAALSAK